MKMIYNPKIANPSEDLSKIPAFILDNGHTVYWGELNKEQCYLFYKYAIKYLWQDGVGSTVATEILGALEDTYPKWVEEFENL